MSQLINLTLKRKVDSALFSMYGILYLNARVTSIDFFRSEIELADATKLKKI